jgi:structural toxin protein (hemagglutinin/hemolysin) RtxA
MYQIVVYVPESHLEQIKTALFEAGAGKVGDYDHCAWQTLGQGQFRPLRGSDPYLGKVDELERVNEFRVELVCDQAVLKRAVTAMIGAHPYEQPAYAVWPLYEVFSDQEDRC